MTEWIGAAEAAERLGIKPASLYAYVSRGVLDRTRDADGREQPVRRRGDRPAGPQGPAPAHARGAQLVIESSLTEIIGDRAQVPRP